MLSQTEDITDKEKDKEKSPRCWEPFKKSDRNAVIVEKIVKRFQKQTDSDLIAKSRQLKIVPLSNGSRDDEIEDCKDEEEEPDNQENVVLHVD